MILGLCVVRWRAAYSPFPVIAGRRRAMGADRHKAKTVIGRRTDKPGLSVCTPIAGRADAAAAAWCLITAGNSPGASPFTTVNEMPVPLTGVRKDAAIHRIIDTPSHATWRNSKHRRHGKLACP